MYLAVYLSALVGYALAQKDDVQYVKSVKGGGGGWQYNPSVNYDRFYGHGHMRQNASQHGHNLWQNTTQQNNGFFGHTMTDRRNYEIGVCYIEVPTAQLARDPAHVPAGNGSRPDLSRIRTCCKGYIRNIHNFRICDPVCTEECVNALCTAPETCSCFPDHVKNLGGVCIPTCPIGCQNGQCSGGECLCQQGYKLNSESQFCIPSCKENCGGVGNCTAPNKCDCKAGYESTLDGSCKPVCDRCLNGNCVAPNECRCLPGFAKSADGSCNPICNRCRNGDCVGPNTCRCHPGYVNNNSDSCEPQCNPGCGPSSRCVAPNICDPPVTTTTSTTPATHISVFPNYPLYPGNQVQPNPGYPGNQFYPNPNQPDHGYPGNHAQMNPSRPGYPGNQAQPNPNQPSHGYPRTQDQPNSNQRGPGYPGNEAEPNPLYPNIQVQTNPSHGEFDLNEELCAQPCINGICVGLNTCRCKPGYYVDSNDPTGTRCIPHCAGGCVNGVCSAPNFCICNVGYYKDTSVKGRPSCVKRIRRSADATIDVRKPVNVAELLVFEIPDIIDNDN